jgi:hypothetical protein
MKKHWTVVATAVVATSLVSQSLASPRAAAPQDAAVALGRAAATTSVDPGDDPLSPITGIVPALPSFDPGQPGFIDPIQGPMTTDADTAAMIDLESKIEDHFHGGHVVEVSFRTAEQLSGDVTHTWSWGDSGEWTGVYAASQAMRYAVAKKHLEALGAAAPGNAGGKGKVDEAPPFAERAALIDFWEAQRDEAVERLDIIYEAQHREVVIAEDWTFERNVPPTVNNECPNSDLDPLDPTTLTCDPTSQRYAADLGASGFQGEKGMLMRACTPDGLGTLGVNEPTTYEDNPTRNNDNRVFPITWSQDGVTYNCETAPSRDTYAGMVFGMLVTFDLVGPDYPELRQQIKDDLVLMGDFLVNWGWNFPRPHGKVSAKHEFDSFITPLFTYVPLARLNIASSVRYVVDAIGTDAERQRWNAIWAEELATQGPLLAVQMEVDTKDNYEPYYKFNLNHLNGFDVLRTTTGAEREFLAAGFAVMDKTTKDEINAHFEAITYALTGEQRRLDLAVKHLREWLQYRENIYAGKPVVNSIRCGTDLACVPQDEYAIYTEDDQRFVYQPGMPDVPPFSESPGMKARDPLPVADRPPWDFLWQRGPRLLDWVDPNNALWPGFRSPGIDFLTPYWMIRYFTEVERPVDRPFPTWVGPSH